MQVAALIFGILGGLSGLSLAAFGHLALSLLGAGGLQGSQQALGKLILYGLPIASFVGAGLVWSKPQLAGFTLLGAALGWFLIGAGFGYGINIFTISTIIFLGVGGFLAFMSVSQQEIFTSGQISISPTSVSLGENAQPIASQNVAWGNFDRVKWNALVKYDSDISRVVEDLEPLGKKWIEVFAADYLALNDKSYLPGIVQKIIAAARTEREEQKRLQEKHDERLRLFAAEQKLRAEIRKKQLNQWRVQAFGTTKGKVITFCTAGIVLLLLAVTVFPGFPTLWIGHTSTATLMAPLTMQECSAKYKAASDGGTLNGRKWDDFRKAQCGSDATAAPAAAPAPATASAPAAAPVPAPQPAPALAAAGNAVFPSAVDSKYSKDSAGKARMETCLDQYNANKENNANGGMKWVQVGGGYFSECNKHMRAKACSDQADARNLHGNERLQFRSQCIAANETGQ
jgi:hypothetical protein